MKFLSLVLVLFSSAAFAAAPGPQKLSLTCDAHELVPGPNGRVGKVVIAASNDGKVLNSPWNVEITWQGFDSLVAPGVVCGADIAADCIVQTHGVIGGTFHLAQACGIGAFDTRGLPHLTSDVSLSLASVGGVTHGRFYCAAYDVGNFANVELANCR